MLGSILLVLALGWLANVDGTDCPCLTAQTTYEVGCCDCPKACSDSACKACCNEACCDDCCLAGEVMCGGESVEMGPAAEQAVVLELRIVETKGDSARKAAFTTFMKPEELRSCLTGIQADPNAVVVSSPTLLLCSGQTGQVNVGTHIPYISSSDCKCESRCEKEASELRLSALPCVSADGRYVNLKLDGCVAGCPDRKEWAWKSEAVLSDGISFVVDSGSLLPVVGQSLKGQPQKNVVVFATVHIGDDKGLTVTPPSTCIRDCCSHPTTPTCCDDCKSCDTVESNLAKLQKASELYKLAEQYERLNRFDVAGKILANVQELCPGSRIATQASEHGLSLAISNVLNHATNLAGVQTECERVFFIDTPYSLKSVAGGEESEVPAKCSKLDQVLCSYRKACSVGNKDRARQLAIEALAMDPTCFAK